jgi:hypothetical protein
VAAGENLCRYRTSSGVDRNVDDGGNGEDSLAGQQRHVGDPQREK